MTVLTALSVCVILAASTFYNTQAGTECPESKKLYPGDCRLFYKCVQLPSPAHAYVWVPTRCSAGLVYQPMLKTCVLPGNAWDCRRGDGSTLSDDIQTDDIFGSAMLTQATFTTKDLTTTGQAVVATESTTIKPKENVTRPNNITQRPLIQELHLANIRKKIAIQNAIATNQLAIHNAVVGNQKALVASQSLPFTNINSPNIDRIGEQLHGLVPLVSRLKAIPKRPAASYRNPFPLKSPAQLPQFLAYPKVELNLLPEQLKKITEQLVMQTATPPLFSTEKTNLNFLAPAPLRYTKHNLTKVDSLAQNPNPHAVLLLSYLSHQGFKVHEDGHKLRNVTFTQLLQKEPTPMQAAKTETPPPSALIKPQLLRKKTSAAGSIRRGPTKRPTASTSTTTKRTFTKKVTKRRKIKPKPSRKRATTTTTTTTSAPVKKVHKVKRTRPHKKRIVTTAAPETSATTTTQAPATTTIASTTHSTTISTTTPSTTTAPAPTPTTTATSTTTTSRTTSLPAVSTRVTESAFLQQIAEANEANLHFISIPSCRDGERFPNPNDCTRYYICSDLTPRKYVCPPYTAFNKGRRVCDAGEYRRCVSHETDEAVTRNYTRVETVFTCETSGKFADPTSTNHYYFCLQNTTSPGWKQRRYQCPDSYGFCQPLHKCTLPNECS